MMKRCSKLLAVLILLGGFSIGLHAQISTNSPNPEWGTNAIAKISEKLGLTDEQKAKVEPILRDSFAKRRAVLEKYQGQRDLQTLRAVRKEMKPIQEETDNQLKAILTKDQMKQFKEMRDNMKSEMRKKLRERQSGS